jgi:hypothetical protein
MNKCEICDNQTASSDYISNKHYLICKRCLRNLEICSKTKSKQLFHLSDDDIKNIKLIYVENNTMYQFYKYEDIKNVAIQKYGSLENLQTITDKKNEQKDVKYKKSEDNKTIRENKIKEAFKFNKLEFKNYGDAYSYIHYGKPSIEVVLNNELDKINQKNIRRNTLANELNKFNIPLNESLKSCYEYINNLSTKPLEDVVRCIEVEHFLKHNTDYDELCKKYNDKKAKEIAIRKYSETQKLPKTIGKYKSIDQVQFE